MTAPLRFALVADAVDPSRDGADRPLGAGDLGLDRLGDALRTRGHDVLVLDGALHAVPPGRWILHIGGDPPRALAACGDAVEQFRSRLALLDEDRVTASALITAMRPRFIVTSRSYRNWLADPRTGAEIVASPALIAALGVATPPGGPTERLRLDHAPLPDGIARCCAALDAGAAGA